MIFIHASYRKNSRNDAVFHFLIKDNCKKKRTFMNLIKKKIKNKNYYKFIEPTYISSIFKTKFCGKLLRWFGISDIAKW